MTEPQSIAQLAKALAAAQAEFKPIVKDKAIKGGSYSYRYADLATVREAVTPALSKYGLAVIQTFRPNGGQFQYLDTLLVHQSGECVTSSYQIPAVGKQQEIGSAATYARRYSLCALLGVVAEDDDDGSAADQKQGVKVEQTVSTQAAGKLDAIANQHEEAYELVDDDGEVTKFKLGLDWLPQCELLLQTSQDASAAWQRNSKAFYAIKDKVTKNKHKSGIERCQHLLALANKLTKPAEMRP